jgi:hypothetical protein
MLLKKQVYNQKFALKFLNFKMIVNMFDKKKALEKFDDFLMIMDDQLDALENDAEASSAPSLIW